MNYSFKKAHIWGREKKKKKNLFFFQPKTKEYPPKKKSKNKFVGKKNGLMWIEDGNNNKKKRKWDFSLPLFWGFDLKKQKVGRARHPPTPRPFQDQKLS